MRCPRCGSNNIQVITNMRTREKGFGVGKGCIGFLLFGWVGWLCGLCGMGERTTWTRVEYVCINCGNRFR